MESSSVDGSKARQNEENIKFCRSCSDFVAILLHSSTIACTTSVGRRAVDIAVLICRNGNEQSMK